MTPEEGCAGSAVCGTKAFIILQMQRNSLEYHQEFSLIHDTGSSHTVSGFTCDKRKLNYCLQTFEVHVSS